MKTALYGIVEWIAQMHDKISSLNDAYEYNFSDKQLHFLVIGLLGIALTLILVPLVKWMVKHKMVLTLTWIYVFTVLVVITFAIEIGQRLTGTGNMEFADIVYGIMGFVAMFAVYAVIRGIILLVIHLFGRLF